MAEFNGIFTGERLAPLKLQYKDYSVWQQKRKQQGLIKKQQEYWLETFSGQLPVIELPTDYLRSLNKSPKGGLFGFFIEKEITRVLRSMTVKYGVTMFMLMLALYNVLLFKLSGQEDIIVGTAADGRIYTDFRGIAGMFVNTLALRNFPKTEKSFTTFLKEVKERTLEAFENHEYQFEDLVGKVYKKRDASRHPLFDVSFSLTDLQGKKFDNTKNDMKLTNTKSLYDLELEIFDYGEKIYITLNYDKNLFKTITIERYINYLKSIVSTITKDPGILLINILDEENKNINKKKISQLAYLKDVEF
jgi:non-ribosomal peptide synthetase component F